MIAVLFFRGEGWDSELPLRGQAGLDGHIEFIRELRDRGVVIEGGPFHDLDHFVDDALVGLALLDMHSVEDATALIETDPVVQAGAYSYSVFEWGGPTPLTR